MKIMVSFVGFILVVTLVSRLTKHQDLPVPNNRFDMKKAKKAYSDKVAEHEKLAKMHHEILNPKKTEESEVKEVKFELALDTPELKRGYDLYAKCVVCHGRLGEGKKSQNAPKIGGQMAWYLEQQLVNMKAGIRVNKKMDPYIRKLDEQDFKDLALYLSKLPWK
jgi:cytochrome c553